MEKTGIIYNRIGRKFNGRPEAISGLPQGNNHSTTENLIVTGALPPATREARYHFRYLPANSHSTTTLAIILRTFPPSSSYTSTYQPAATPSSDTM